MYYYLFKIMNNKEPLEYCPESARLKRYNYCKPGAYFVTICTYGRICLLGDVKDGTLLLNNYGNIVKSCWEEIPDHFPAVIPAPYLVMPNHLHGIIIISETPPVETRHAVSKINPVSHINLVSHIHPVSNSETLSVSTLATDYGSTVRNSVSQNTAEAFQKPVAGSLATIIRSFKSAATKRLNELHENLPASIWQRNYYDHVIRNEGELNRVIEYISHNPEKWETDKNNPINISKR
jgi:putative transposase